MSSKSKAYESEEARLEAQRRMLAERYGLGVSDDDDDDEAESSDDASGSVTDSPQDSPAQDPAVPSNGKKLAFPHVLAENTAVKASTRPAAASPSTPMRSPLKNISPDFSVQSALWPGVVVCSEGQPIPVHFTYDRDEAQITAAARRNIEVMPVARYASQFLEGHGRKVAVNDSVVAYVVGGHIRGIVRNSSILALLKGHESTVVDMEFLSSSEKSVGPAGASCSVLGSVDESGVAYIWRLLRTGPPDGPPQEQGTFQIADAIPVVHPLSSSGAGYHHIAFRPGNRAVVAANGVGVALLLVDRNSPDIRSMEMVKMGGDKIERENMLYACEESIDEFGVDASVSVTAGIWLNEHVVVVARGSSVMFWHYQSATCIGRLPRRAETEIHSLHALPDDVLLVTACNGRMLEIWHTSDLDKKPTMRLFQSVTLSEWTKVPFVGVISVDPEGEIITVANAKASYVLVLHYNLLRKCIDSITEIATVQPMLSTTLTRSKKLAVKKDANRSAMETREAKGADEIEFWYVLPEGIRMMSLNVPQFAPKSKAREIPSPAPLASSSSLANKAFALDPTQNKILESSPPSTSNLVSPAKPASPKMPKVLRKLQTAVSPKPATSVPVVGDAPKQESVTILQPKRVLMKTSPEPKSSTPRKIIASPPSGSSVKKEPTTVVETAQVAETGTTKPKKEETADPSEITEEAADAIIAATKKIIEGFEEKGRLRDIAENERIERLVTTLREKLEGNIERSAKATVKKCYGNVIIPRVSEALAKATPDEKAVNASRQEYFSNAFVKSDLVTMYKAGCDEIRDQIGGTVERSMNDKQISLIEPAMRSLQEAGEDISKTVGAFVKQLEVGGVPANGTGKTAPEDVRGIVTALLEAGRIDDAFLMVLNKGDLELVSWLVRHFDPKTFFENSNIISQDAVLSLAQQIGQRLGVDDEEYMESVEWLRELMLALQPNDDSIADIVGDTLVELRKKISMLQRDEAMAAKHPLLPKHLKQLGYVIISVASQ